MIISLKCPTVYRLLTLEIHFGSIKSFALMTWLCRFIPDVLIGFKSKSMIYQWNLKQLNLKGNFFE